MFCYSLIPAKRHREPPVDPWATEEVEGAVGPSSAHN